MSVRSDEKTNAVAGAESAAAESVKRACRICGASVTSPDKEYCDECLRIMASPEVQRHVLKDWNDPRR